MLSAISRARVTLFFFSPFLMNLNIDLPMNFKWKEEIKSILRYWDNLPTQFYSLKNMRSTHGEVLLLVTATLLKITLLHGCFSGLLNCANGTKSRRVKYITDSNLKYSPYFSAGSHGNTCMKFPLVHFNTKQNYKERHLSKIVSWAIAKSVI